MTPIILPIWQIAAVAFGALAFGVLGGLVIGFAVGFAVTFLITREAA